MQYAKKERFSKPHSPADILRLALEKEKSSYAFYTKIIEEATNPALITVLRRLRRYEKDHIKVIEGLLKK